MRTGKDLQGIAVVDVDGGRKLGQADELVISPDELRLIGVVVKSGGLLDKQEFAVAADDIRSIGPDAITLDDDRATSIESTSEAFRAAREGDRRLMGNKVVTRDGTLVGLVDDFVLDEGTKQVVGLKVSDGVLSAGHTVQADTVVSVGPDVIVVDDRAQKPTR